MEHVRVAVVGAGFAGIGAAVTLTRAGHEVLVLERASRIGGTWRDNSYPGCACDVPSDLYSFSFAPNPGWSHAYASQPEILAYLEDVVTRTGIRDRIRCGVDVREAAWDAESCRWRVETSTGALTCDVLVAAAGALSEPRTPDLPGLDTFRGRVLHTGRWGPSVDLTGRRVAVVGTGASAIQLVPRLAGRAAAVTVLQRTPPWILPRHDHEVPPRRRRTYARHPRVQQATRWVQYGRHELRLLAFTHPGVMRLVETRCLHHLREQIPDPGLRELLTPDYRPGCKRILLSSDYYPALLRDDVELVASAAARVEPDAVVAADGSRREADVIVFATGFTAAELPVARHVRGRDGRLLADVWAGTGMQALRGTTVHGFPNLFFVVGPNTGLGHTSLLQMIEAQLAYLADALRVMDRRGLGAIEPTTQAQAAWNAELASRLRGTVWVTGGCESWYQDADGRVTTLWPASTARFRLGTRHVDLTEYRLTYRVPARATARRPDGPPGVPVPGGADEPVATDDGHRP